MKKKLLVSIKNITPEQWQSIRAAAEELGWTALISYSREDALEAAKDAEVIFGDSTRFVADAPDLRWICTPSAGINKFVNSEAFRKSGVMLSNSSGAYGTAIAEHIVMVLLGIYRMMPEYQKLIGEKIWYDRYDQRSIKGSRIVILGTGDIGTETAIRLRAFGPAKLTGVNTTGRDTTGYYDEVLPIDRLSEILPETDVLIMAIPLTEKTYHIVDKDKLGLLPDGGVIVNVGRGACIEQAALMEELKSGRLKAALDVFETEPIPADSEVWDCPGLIITPHVAGDMFVPYTVQRIVDLFIEDFRRYAAGELPERLLDLEKGY